jgi:hypothetical protein
MKSFTILLWSLTVLLPLTIRGQFVSVDQPGVQPWASSSTWEGGTIPGTFELTSTVLIQSYVDQDGDLSLIGLGDRLSVGVGIPSDPGSITSYDVLVVRGNLDFDKQSAGANAIGGLKIESNGIVIVFGDLTFVKNRASLVNDGILTVTGEIEGGGPQSTYVGSGLVVLNQITPTEFPISGFGALPLGSDLADIDSDICDPTYLAGDPRRPILDALCDFLNSGGGSPLPVNLNSFRVQVEQGVSILKWSTASEVNNDYFLVQRSYDAVNYQTIGTVEGKGTVIEAQTYNFRDGNALPGTVYYRLVQTDYDGTTETFGPVVVQLGLPSEALHVYPNPLDRGVLTIQFAGLESDRTASLQIADLTGKTVFTDEVMVSRQGAGRVDLELPQQLRRGAYIVNLAQGGKRYSEKLIKIQ